MERKEDTPIRQIRRRYEDKHKEERKVKSKVFGTSIDRKLCDEIDTFLRENGYSKAYLIYKGYEALQAEKNKQ